MRRAFVWALVCGLLLLAGPADACGDLLGVRIDCDPTPSPSPTARTRADGSGGAEADLLDWINRSRRARGLAALRVAPEAAAVARRHAARMERRGDIFHNPALRTPEGIRSLGNPGLVLENVGNGPSALSLHKAFMRSPGHRRAILEPRARSVGIGVVWDGHNMWAVEVFVDKPGVRGPVSDVGTAEAERALTSPAPEAVTVEAAGRPAPPDRAGSGVAALVVGGLIGPVLTAEAWRRRRAGDAQRGKRSRA